MATRNRTVALVILVLLTGCATLSPPPESGVETTNADTAGSRAGASPSATPTSPPATSTPPSATATPHRATGPQVRVTVVDVVDGDTLHVRYRNGTRDTVRLLGVDTPETRGENTPDEFEGVPETAAGRRCLGQWGERASAFATDELADERVRLGFDPEEGRRGYYGRLLAYVWIDGTQFNYRLIRQGYARMYDSSFVERSRYAPAEQRARQDRRGLWACSAPTTDGGPTASTPAATDGGTATDTPTARTSTADAASVRVSIHADAEGNDHENRNDEYVTLTNTGDGPLTLDGWTVADEAGHTYRFGDGTTLEAGESLTLYTGSGEDTATERYWGQSGAVWNNGGDTVLVRDANGNLVTRHSYD